MRLQLHIVLISALLLLSGCNLLPDPNGLAQQGNTITNESLDLTITISDDYTYQGTYEYSDYTKFTNATGGTNNVGNVALFSNIDSKSFILINKVTCNRRCTYYATSNVSESEEPTSFYVGRKKIYKQNNLMSLNKGADNELIKLLNADIENRIIDGEFNTSGYANAVRNSYFNVLVATHQDQPTININDVVTLNEI